jgi:sigma-54 specific flagellar transcriptional regulator A
VTTADGKEDLPLRPVEIGANDDEGVRSLLSGAGGFNLKDYVSALEVAFIRVALEDEEGSVSAAARRLGIQRTTLIEKMRKFGIGRPD